jgi:N-acetylglucosaminyldiphosphoundecaprenol N-acetyl-beta-D-mannosaminyltransferase
MKTIPVLNCEFAAVTAEDAVEWARSWIRSGQRGYICTVNVAILMMMRSDPRLQRFVDNASLVVVDGQPIVWASRLQAEELPERVAGVDLVEDLCSLAAGEGWGVYFLGARRDVVQAAAQRLKKRIPGLEVSGYADGYFDAAEAPKRARAVRESGAKILFVGMGVPRQETFIEEQWNALGAPLVIPVGGSFDVIAGLTQRAPKLLQRTGLEWAYRLAQEPRRLWKRYLVTNTQFIFHLLRSTLSFTRRSR